VSKTAQNGKGQKFKGQGHLCILAAASYWTKLHNVFSVDINVA